MGGRVIVAIVVALSLPGPAGAQVLGAFRWQQQPYCNVLTLTVTQVGGVFTLDGFDNLCGAAQRAPVAGTASINPDGSIGMGLVIVAPGSPPVHMTVNLNLATISGTWRDAALASGAFAFNPTSVSGAPRPAPAAIFATGLVAGQTTFAADGGFAARGTEGVGSVPATGPGARVVWYPGKAAFRAGRAGFNEWDDPAIGLHSIALGDQPFAGAIGAIAIGSTASASGVYALALGVGARASGAHSSAIGSATEATGGFATALGRETTASGAWSTALGRQSTSAGTMSTAWGMQSTASGTSSTAGGEQAAASGDHAVALGRGVTASGDASVALGTQVSTANRHGSFIFGDSSGVVSTVPTANNQFVVRATGGVRFLTATNLVNGCEIAPSTGNLFCTGTITSSSDRHRKADLAALDGEEVLRRLADVPVTTWSFIDQPGVRHAGPTAQDFRAAFGLGENDVTIAYTDINGINMRAIQALDARTRELMTEVSALRARLAELERQR